MWFGNGSSQAILPLRRALMLGAVAILATGCADSSIAPARQQRGLRVNRPVLDRMTGSSTFTYDPADSLYTDLGNGSSLSIPANGVCDPATSSYGIGEWDKACDALSQPITITVQSWVDTEGHPYIQFEPALRFVPDRLTKLYVNDSQATQDLAARIIYCPDAGMCLDEVQVDSSLATFHWSGGVFRRIKHFSGYNVAAGDERDPSDPGSGF